MRALAIRRAARGLIGAGALSVLVAGCVGRYESDFPVIVVNRMLNPIQAIANGNVVGDVAPGASQSFSIKLEESGGNVYQNGTAPTPTANVTFTAKDTRTGALSDGKEVTLNKENPTYIAFSTDDFPSTAPTVARFTFSPTNPTINQDVSFNGNSSSVSNGTFAWDFGDGQTGTGVTTTYRYTRGGTFTVTLTVTADSRQTSSSSRTINVATALPPTTANFTFAPVNPGVNQDVVFNATGTQVPGRPGGPGPGATGYTWDFGDGTTGSGQTVTHRFARGGSFAVTLRVTSDTGLTATLSRQINVSTTLPAGSASFVFSPTDPHTGDDIFFNASASTLVDGTFTWDFGDGSSGSGVRPVHSYSRARTYTVSLTVRNSLGQSATTSRSVTVLE